MSRATNRVGRVGETLAARALEAQGLRIVARNWRPAGAGLRGELDIVALTATQPPTLVVCEVKARRRAVSAEEALAAVSWRKRAQLRALASAYLNAQDLRPAAVRFDVVAVTWPEDGQRASVTHLEDVL